MQLAYILAEITLSLQGKFIDYGKNSKLYQRRIG